MPTQDFRLTYENAYISRPFSLTAHATYRVYGGKAVRFRFRGTACAFFFGNQFGVPASQQNNINVPEYGITGGTGGWYRVDGGAWARHPGGNTMHTLASGLTDDWHIVEFVIEGGGPGYALKVGAADNTELSVTGANPAIDHDPDNFGTFVPKTLSGSGWQDDPEAANIVAWSQRIYQSDADALPSDDHGRYTLLLRHQAKRVMHTGNGLGASGTWCVNTTTGPFHQKMLYDQVDSQKVTVSSSTYYPLMYSRATNEAQTLRFFGKNNAHVGFIFSGYPAGQDAVLPLPELLKVASVGTSLTVHQEAGPNGGGPGDYPEFWTASKPTGVFLGRGWGGSSMVDWYFEDNGTTNATSYKAGINQTDEIIAFNPHIMIVSHQCNDLASPSFNAAIFKARYKQFLEAILDPDTGADNLQFVFCSETEGLYQGGNPNFAASSTAIQEAAAEVNAGMRAVRGPNPFHVSGDYCFFVSTASWKADMTIVSGRISSGDGIHPTYEGHAYSAMKQALAFDPVLDAGPFVFGKPRVGSKFADNKFMVAGNAMARAGRG